VARSIACLAVVALFLGGEPPASATPRDGWEYIHELSPVLKAVARGEPLQPSGRALLYECLRYDNVQVHPVAVCAWALARAGDRGALPHLKAALPRVRKRHSAHSAVYVEDAAGFLRSAILRLQPMAPAARREQWARLLRSGRSNLEEIVIRTEAAKQLVSLKHPRALQLLSAEAERSRWSGNSADELFLTQVIWALGELRQPSAAPLLRSFLKDARHLPRKDSPYVLIVQLEQCHELAQPNTPCFDVRRYLSVEAYARRALARIGASADVPP
jgi:HEAT repeat protein